MKRTLTLVLLMLIVSLVFADPHGITTSVPDDGQGFWSGGRASVGRPVLNITPSGVSNADLERWQEVSRIDFDEYLEAGKYLGVEYNPWNFQFNRVSNQSTVNTTTEAAINRAPLWLQPQLRYTLSQLSSIRQTVWANVILDAVSPYIDEICYSIAHSSPAYLTRVDIYPQIMVENAELIYAYADEFPFVNIVEHGSEASGDWYSTTSYHKMDEFGIARWVEVDRETYYMYVVHPKFTDEIPNYIDPEHSESNSSHANNFAAPPVGRFWREYLYYHNDEGYPKLRDMLLNCIYVYGSPVYAENAIKQINSWVSASMVFTSDAERPHQPIRIYDKHIGRCGEHQDLRGACGRIALIPTKGINCISGDHVWDEFWDERWIHWDGGDIDNPLLYENGWGRHYGSIFEQRSDGKFIPVSDRYSDGHATLNIWAIDAQNRPIDGAMVYLRVDLDGEPYFDNVGVTDDNGLCTFIVGEDRKYYARVNSVVQNMPSSGYDLLVENAANNAVYDFTFQSTQSMNIPNVTEIPVPDGTGSLYKIVADFSSEESLVVGNSVFDDASGGKNCEPTAPGSVDFYMTDSGNYAMATSGFPFSAFNVFTDAEEGNVEFLTNTSDYWYAFLMNGHNVSNPKRVEGSFTIYTTDTAYQTGTLNVNVVDIYGLAVSGTSIVLMPNNLSYTLQNSTASLPVPQGTYDIYCYPSDSQPNYLPTSVQGVYISAGGNQDIEFTLLENDNPASRVIAWEEGENVHISWNNTSNENRLLVCYNVYRGLTDDENNVNSDNWELVNSINSGSSCIDTEWSDCQSGIYRWIVEAVYTAGDTNLAYSNSLAHDMTANVTFNLTTNTGTSPQGTEITLRNLDGNQYHRYTGVVEGSSLTIQDVWLGDYTLTASLHGFTPYTDELAIGGDVVENIEITELLANPANPYVTNSTLLWSNPFGETRNLTGYKVFLNGVMLIQTTETSYTFTGLNSGTIYTAGVSAVYTTGESGIAEISFQDGESMAFGIVAQYNFDGDYNDQSGSGNNLTAYNDIAFTNDAVSGQAVVLDGISDYLETAISPSLNEAALHYTVKVWIKPRVRPVDWTGVIGKPGRNYHLWLHPNGYVHHRFHTEGNTNNGAHNTPDGAITWGEWNQVVLTNDGSIARTYVNGVLLAEAAFNGELVADESVLIIGRHLDGGSMNGMFDGLIDECTIWTRALAPAEIEQVYLNEQIPLGFVTGIVSDADSNPIADARISIGSRGAVTDVSGSYTLTLLPGDYTITCHAIGYEEYTDIVSVVSEQTETMNITLNEYAERPWGLFVQDYSFAWSRVGLDMRDFIEYKVYLDNALIATIQDTSYTFTGLTPGQLYMAGVEAVFDIGTSERAETGFIDGTSLRYLNTLSLPLDGDYSEIHGNTPASINGDLEFLSDSAYSNYLHFDGVGDYLELLPTDILGFHQSSFTASAWIKLELNDTNDTAVFGTTFSGATNGGLHLTARTGRLGMRFYGNDTNIGCALIPRIWYQITYCYDLESLTQSIYLNGKLIAQGNNKTPFSNAGVPVFIGQANDTMFFTGGMKHISVWNRALNQFELKNLYDTTKPDYGFVSGVVRLAGNNEPLAGVTVSAGDASTTTDSHGSYLLPLVQGTWNISFRPGIHTEFTVNDVIVIADEETVLDYLYDFTATEEEEQPVTRTELNSLFPNPFNPTTTILFTLGEKANVSLKVYDVKGRLIRKLVDEIMIPGQHYTEWNGLDENDNSVSSGIYFIHMISGKTTEVRKAVLLK
ncbi:MAG: carboxypeptidase regulatory-like domain-containing protein [Candidatus Cloacimonetes bacterium]|nr:carboxypeptidase regulatory-like domain-containing protein [Candidatus Cloacimonadota bacterium]